MCTPCSNDGPAHQGTSTAELHTSWGNSVSELARMAPHPPHHVAPHPAHLRCLPAAGRNLLLCMYGQNGILCSKTAAGRAVRPEKLASVWRPGCAAGRRQADGVESLITELLHCTDMFANLVSSSQEHYWINKFWNPFLLVVWRRYVIL